jgi:hypothetical protein
VIWTPHSEGELQSAADNGLLQETHYLDLKRELPPPSDSANKDLAKDIASFAFEGGTIIVGVDEGPPPSRHPIELKGQAERMEQIAAMRVQEGVQVKCTEIASAADPERGYLVVEIPASSRAPHMVDGKYYGRGDKRNRVLSHAEVLRIHQQQIAEQRSILTVAQETLADLVKDHIASPPLLLLIAEPMGAREDLLVPLADSSNWQETVFSMLRAAEVDDRQKFNPSLMSPDGFPRRPGGVAAMRTAPPRFCFGNRVLSRSSRTGRSSSSEIPATSTAPSSKHSSSATPT